MGNSLNASAHASTFVVTWSSRDHHGPITDRLTFCGYPQVSMSSSSMLIAATGRCRWLLIWIREFATLKQSQSQHSWRSFTLHICVQTSVTDTGEPLLRNDRAPMTGVSYMQVCAVFLSWYSTPFRAFLEIGVRPGGCYRNCLRYWPIIIWMKMCSAFFLSFFFCQKLKWSFLVCYPPGRFLKLTKYWY